MSLSTVQQLQCDKNPTRLLTHELLNAVPLAPSSIVTHSHIAHALCIANIHAYAQKETMHISSNIQGAAKKWQKSAIYEKRLSDKAYKKAYSEVIIQYCLSLVSNGRLKSFSVNAHNQGTIHKKTRRHVKAMTFIVVVRFFQLHPVGLTITMLLCNMDGGLDPLLNKRNQNLNPIFAV